MPSHAPETRPEAPPPAEADPSPESDYARARDFAGFVARAPARHRRLAAAVFLVTIIVSLGAALFAPRTYVVDTKILAQRNLIMPSLGNPRRSVPSDSDAPTRSASDVILSRDSLLGIIKETDLLARWTAERPPLLRLKDGLGRLGREPQSEADRTRALIAVLEKKLHVAADDSTIRITLEWPHPETAFRIVSSAEKSFFEGRRAAEIAVIVDTIDILQGEADRQRDLVDLSFARVVDLRRQAMGVGRAPQVTTIPAPPSRQETVTYPAPPLPEEQHVAARLDEKRRAIRALEEPRQQRIAQLTAELARLRLTDAEAHPAVLQAEAELKVARMAPSGLAELRREEAELVARLTELASPDRRAARAITVTAAPRRESGGASVVVDASPREDEPELATAKTKLTAATRKYEDLLDRVDSARIELHTAQAAFKYRYTVIDPPEVPKEPKRPNRALLVVGGLGLGVVLALFSAAARDLTGGRFVEPWQARRRLGLPILAELRRP